MIKTRINTVFLDADLSAVAPAKVDLRGLTLLLFIFLPCKSVLISVKNCRVNQCLKARIC